MRNAHWTLIAGAVALFLVNHPAVGGLIVYEGFDYGVTNASINSQNGGTGFGGAWSANAGSYLGLGLSFGSNLAVTGGAAIITGGGFPNNTSFTRPIGVTQTGTIYGSYLFQEDADTTQIIGTPPPMGAVNALLIGAGTADTTASYDLAANEFNSNNGGVRGVPVTTAFPNYLTGSAPSLATGTTYMFLFKLTNVGSTNETVSAWILSQDQYDNSRTTPTSLETSLNAATIGTGTTNVLQRGSFNEAPSNTATGTFTTTDFLSLYAFASSSDSTTARFDEIRIANASLEEVAPVPEPATLVLFAAGGIGLLAAARAVKCAAETVD